MTQWGTGISLRGTNGSSVRNGMGPPDASNPPVQFDGDFYFDCSGTVPVLYGPRANGAWPASGVPTGGSTIYPAKGFPSSSIGAVGDWAIDSVNGFLYGPKTLSQGWAGSPPISIVGPTGPTGQVQPAFGTFSAGCGPAAYALGVGVSGTPTVMNVGSTSGMPNYFVPVTDTSFMGAQVVNFGNSGSAVTFQLYNNTTGSVVYQASSLAIGTVSTIAKQSTGTYPMPAGNSYSWRVTGSGTAYCYIVPMYAFQCGAAQGVSTFAAFTLNNATLSGTAATMNPAFYGSQTMYYRSPSAGYLYAMQVAVTGTASASVTFAGYTTTAVTAANSPQYFGPFVAASNALAANTNYTATVTGSGTGTVMMIPSVVQ